MFGKFFCLEKDFLFKSILTGCGPPKEKYWWRKLTRKQQTSYSLIHDDVKTGIFLVFDWSKSDWWSRRESCWVCTVTEPSLFCRNFCILAQIGQIETALFSFLVKYHYLVDEQIRLTSFNYFVLGSFLIKNFIVIMWTILARVGFLLLFKTLFCAYYRSEHSWESADAQSSESFSII